MANRSAPVIGAGSYFGLFCPIMFVNSCVLAWLVMVTPPALAPSDHFDGDHFYNTNPHERAVKGVGSVIQWKLRGTAIPWPDSLPNLLSADLPARVPSGEMFATYVTHASVLLQFDRFTVLTDPVYSERVSPISWVGPRRVHPPGIAWDELPRIDAVLISHNHYDHLDLPTLQRLWQRDRCTFLVPWGDRELLLGAGIGSEDTVIQLDWWQSHLFFERGAAPGHATGKQHLATVTFTEAQHWSGRGVLDRNQSLWGGYVVQAGGVQVFFAGDTGYGEHFKRIRARLGPMDFAVLPIGAYLPRLFMRSQHMNPEDAVLAHLDLQARRSIGVHYGTFHLSDEAIDAPPRDLQLALQARHIPQTDFMAPLPGETVYVQGRIASGQTEAATGE